MLEVRNQGLQNLQDNVTAPAPAAEPNAAPAPEAAPGVDLETERVFTDENQPKPEGAPAETESPPAPPPVTAVPSPSAGPSLMSRVLDWVASPILWIGLGVAALLFTALWFVRRRRQEPEDVTGRWEALEAEVDEEVREATARMRAQIPEESILVEEQDVAPRPKRSAPAARVQAETDAESPFGELEPAADETLSSQTVINLDQADPVAEADFHMAYGLYDQAAELITKALEAQPKRRDLKLKLLEVFFVWGNKEAFLSAAQDLRSEIGARSECRLGQGRHHGQADLPRRAAVHGIRHGAAAVDVDLEAGESPLDLAFDDAAGGIDLDLSEGDEGDLDFQLEASGTHAKPASRPAASAPKAKESAHDDDSLDIGERTAAGLEAALFMEEEDQGAQTTPDLSADSLIDSLAVTQESPTVESPQGRTAESLTEEYESLEGPTVETPTIESPAADAPTMETPTVETSYRDADAPTMETPTVETPYVKPRRRRSSGRLNIPATDRTAEIDLDDLGPRHRGSRRSSRRPRRLAGCCRQRDGHARAAGPPGRGARTTSCCPRPA